MYFILCARYTIHTRVEGESLCLALLSQLEHVYLKFYNTYQGHITSQVR